MSTLSESEVEAILLQQLQGLGYACLNDAISGPDGSNPERDAYSDTIFPHRLREAVARLAREGQAGLPRLTRAV